MSPIESIYIHFPHCRHFCNYCDFYKTLLSENQNFEDFHNYLNNSWNSVEHLLTENSYSIRNIKTLYIGGGTPSLWGARGAEFLNNYLNNKKIKLDKNCEFTLEVNPGSWTKEDILAWKDIGVNRFSLGTQTLNPNILKFLDRVHSVEEVYETLSFFKDNDFSFSVDFMLGLPESVSSYRNIESELDELIDKFSPNHLSLYILTVGKKYVHYQSLPDEKFVEDEFLKVSKKLIENNFEHYEVSNFAKKGFESVHNKAYWKSNSVLALGPSATGYLDKGIRFKWKATRPVFDIETLNENQVLLEKIYLAMRTKSKLELTKYAKSETSLKEINQLTESWVKDGYFELKNGDLYPTSRGFLIMDSLINELFHIEDFL